MKYLVLEGTHKEHNTRRQILVLEDDFRDSDGPEDYFIYGVYKDIRVTGTVEVECVAGDWFEETTYEH